MTMIREILIRCILDINNERKYMRYCSNHYSNESRVFVLLLI